jgi:hypothetical protein
MATKSSKPSKSTKDVVLGVHLPWQDKEGLRTCNGHLTITFAYKDKGNSRSVDLKKSKGKLLTLSIVGGVNFGIGKGEHWGQCIDTVREIWGHIPEVTELCDLWERWHLNDLVAGTRKQMEVIRSLGKCPVPSDWYTWACLSLKAHDLLVDQGYEFGHDWLYEPIPAKVVARIKALTKEI